MYFNKCISQVMTPCNECASGLICELCNILCKNFYLNCISKEYNGTKQVKNYRHKIWRVSVRSEDPIGRGPEI